MIPASKKWIGSAGPRDARLCLVGRDPGSFEMYRGTPFVGPAGGVLNRALKQAKLVRAECLITNVVGTRPLGDEWFRHDRADIERGLAELERTLSYSKRDLIVAMGEQALHACLGLAPDAKQYSITEVRGYTFAGPYGPVLACVHPAFILRSWVPWWASFCLDLQKASRVLQGRFHRIGQGEAWAEDPAVARAFLESARGKKKLAVDIETTGSGLSVHPGCIAFSFDPAFGLCLPWKAEYLPIIKALLDCEVAKVFHNGQFDVTILERHAMPVRNWTTDTMLLWHVCEPLLAGKQEGKKGKRTEKSLRFLASLLTDEAFWKNYDFHTEEEQYLLCAKDARITLEICEKLEARLCAAGTGERDAA